MPDHVTEIYYRGGYTANTARLMTVPTYACASVIILIIAYASDRLRVRGIVMFFRLPVAMVG